MPLFRTTSTNHKEDEAKYLQIFNRIEISTGFYFSYSYDLTRSLQENMMRKIRNKLSKSEPILSNISDIYATDIYAEEASNPSSKLDKNQTSQGGVPAADDELKEFKPWDSQMMWNYFLVRDFYSTIKRKKWVMPVIRGYIDQKNFIDGGNKFSIMVIARRSRHFAGTRYLRRGINHEGFVANWVEVEQIIDR